MSKWNKIGVSKAPKYTIIETTALALAAEWYDIGKAQGMTSKWPTAKLFAKNNLERFIPKSVEILLSMLDRQDLSDVLKEEVYNALMERHNDPTLISMLPNIDVEKIIALHQQAEQQKSVIITTKQGHKAARH